MEKAKDTKAKPALNKEAEDELKDVKLFDEEAEKGKDATHKA